MTNLYDGQITDLLNNGLKNNPEIQALSFAIQQEKQRILRMADTTRTAAVIDELPEAVLDHLAVELRTQYYGADLPIETKRTLIKNTLIWYQKAGTLAAVKELSTIAYGDCDVQEWFQYGGQPGYFKVDTSSFQMVYDNLEMFFATLEKVKRLSAHLEKVTITSNISQNVGVGFMHQIKLSKTYTMEEFSLDDLFTWLVDENGAILVDEDGQILIE